MLHGKELGGRTGRPKASRRGKESSTVYATTEGRRVVEAETGGVKRSNGKGKGKQESQREIRQERAWIQRWLQPLQQRLQGRQARERVRFAGICTLPQPVYQNPDEGNRHRTTSWNGYARNFGGLNIFCLNTNRFGALAGETTDEIPHTKTYTIGDAIDIGVPKRHAEQQNPKGDETNTESTGMRSKSPCCLLPALFFFASVFFSASCLRVLQFGHSPSLISSAVLLPGLLVFAVLK